MKKSSSRSLYIEFLLIFSMFLLSFITFNYIFSRTTGGSYYQEVIAALLGTVFTVVITSILLRQQSKNEELKEQNIEVFKKRVERYEQVTQLLIQVTEDNKIDENEAKQLKSAIYNLALLSSEDTITTISKFLRKSVIGDDHIDVTFFDVISQFRKELRLEGIEEFAANDIDAIDSLIAAGFDQIDVFKEIRNFLDRIRGKMQDFLRESMETEAFKMVRFGKVEGTFGSALSFEICNENIESAGGMMRYDVIMNYPETQTIEKLTVELFLWFLFDLAGNPKQRERLFKEETQEIHRIAEERGFKWIELPEDKDFTPHFYKSYPIRFKKSEHKGLTITDRSVHLKILEDILSLEQFEIEEVEEDDDNLDGGN